MEQVLMNLLENALHYTPSGSEIEISGRSVNESIELRVLDHGPGIPPGSELKLFEKYFRGDPLAE